MRRVGRTSLLAALLGVSLAFAADHVFSQDVPVDGYLPFVGIGLTNEYDDNFNFFPTATSFPSGTLLGPGGTPHYDVALLDTGAGFSLLTDQAFDEFGLSSASPGEPDGYVGTETIQVGGATGQTFASINDPFGLYVGGLQGKASAGASLTMNLSALKGQTNTSTITMPPSSALPNVVGLPFASQYATRIRSDDPQVFELEGKTVRTPAIDFLPLGSGGNGITRKAPLSLNPGSTFASPPGYLMNIINFDIDNPQENPSLPTAMQGGLFLNVNAANGGSSLGNKEFFFDTGASVTVVSQLNALLLGFDVLVDEPDFSIAVVGSGGTTTGVPGFFVDEITIVALGGSITAQNVPVIVLDVTDPSDPGNIVEGIVGTNLLAGRNVVIDPNPSLGGGGESAGLYISDPVTKNYAWGATAASAAWGTAASWKVNNVTATAAPDYLAKVNLSNATSSAQEAVVTGDQRAGDVVVAGGSVGQPMTMRIASGASLTTFSGATIEAGGIIQLQDATLDVQFVDVRGGRLTGDGLIVTGSGPIAGQVEVVSGIVAPGDGVGALEIVGRFSNGPTGTLEIELGGLTPTTEHDQLMVDGTVALDGKLAVSLVDSFLPSEGDRFTILTGADGVGGEFSLFDLPSEHNWLVDYQADFVDLVVMNPGDFNSDGVVDAADYAVWRNGLGTRYTAAQYNDWRSNYGHVQSLAASANAPASAPEPGCGLLALLLLPWAASRSPLSASPSSR